MMTDLELLVFVGTHHIDFLRLHQQNIITDSELASLIGEHKAQKVGQIQNQRKKEMGLEQV